MLHRLESFVCHIYVKTSTGLQLLCNRVNVSHPQHELPDSISLSVLLLLSAPLIFIREMSILSEKEEGQGQCTKCIITRAINHCNSIRLLKSSRIFSIITYFKSYYERCDKLFIFNWIVEMETPTEYKLYVYAHSFQKLYATAHIRKIE